MACQSRGTTLPTCSAFILLLSSCSTIPTLSTFLTFDELPQVLEEAGAAWLGGSSNALQYSPDSQHISLGVLTSRFVSIFGHEC